VNIASLIDVYRKDFTDDINPAKYRWNDEFLLISFNEAQKQACNRTDFLFSTTQFITLVPGRGSYSLPSNLNRLLALTLYGYELTKALPEQLSSDWRLQTGFYADPDRRFIVRGNTVTFTPTPDAADTGLKVYVEGYVQPDVLLTLTDELQIPEEFQHETIHWVLGVGYSNDDCEVKDELKSQTHFDKFDKVFGLPVPANVRQHQFETNMR
jgi:hypothetical protein